MVAGWPSRALDRGVGLEKEILVASFGNAATDDGAVHKGFTPAIYFFILRRENPLAVIAL